MTTPRALHRICESQAAQARLLVMWFGLGLLLPLTQPTTTQAQQTATRATIRGVVRDSLDGGIALNGATVRIATLGMQAHVDTRGRFEFRNLPSGRHALTAYAARLDSLGLDTLRGVIDAVNNQSVSVVLATPSRETYATRMCGAPLPEGLGVIRGRLVAPSASRGPVHDAERVEQAERKVEIGALWLETFLAIGQMERREMGASSSAALNADFILCGVPTGVEIVLRVTDQEPIDTLRVFARIPQFVAYRNLVIGPADPGRSQIAIMGRVLNARGQPLPSASVADAVTGELLGRPMPDGQFALQQPAHSQQLMIRDVGYEPRFVDVEPTATTMNVGDVRLSPVPPQLATMLVEGRRVTAAELAFEARRRTGLGSFIDESVLSKAPIVTSAYVASQAMIARTEGGPGGRRQLMLWRGKGPCRPRFYIDGYDNGSIDVYEEEAVLQRAKRIEIYRAAFAPPEFNDFDGCGAVVIWTQ